MGGTRYDDGIYAARTATRAATKAATGIDATFAHDAHARATGVYTISPLVDPKWTAGDKSHFAGQRVRESRDSDVHPESFGVAVIFDTTGSMAGVPRVLQEKLSKLPGILARKGVTDAHVLFGAINDATTGCTAPLQLGQFEAGIEMDDAITSLLLEGGGGGSNEESYELAAYFLANNAHMDCLEKRGKKGYLFIIGDEKPYKKVSRRYVKEYIGDDIQADLDTNEVFNQLKEKFEVFFILPAGTSNWGNRNIISRWEEIVGQNIIQLKEPANICETIATQVLLCEGKVELDNLTDIGLDAKSAANLSSALAVANSGRELAVAGNVSGTLAISSDSDVERL